MTETQYKEHLAGKPKVPPISLLEITGQRHLITSLEAFGPNTYSGNLQAMQGLYSHPQTGDVITFKEPTTAESILAASYDFQNRAKPKILDSSWLQLGRIVRTSEGVYANPPKDAQGAPITDKKTLKSFLKSNKKINGIWLLDNDFGFAPCETFRQGFQEHGDFVESGLARLLEFTQGRAALNLKTMGSQNNYKNGVNVRGFNSVREPVLEVASLSSDWLDARLNVDGDYWLDGDGGFAFGVLNSGEASAQNSK